MWRRIHSNRAPGDTLGRELRKEFGRYFDAAGERSSRLAGKYPKPVFGLMVALLIVSLVLSFTVFRHPRQVKIAPAAKLSPLQDGAGQILRAAEKIRETMALKHLVDSISAKKVLNAADSTALDSALTRLERLRTAP